MRWGDRRTRRRASPGRGTSSSQSVIWSRKSFSRAWTLVWTPHRTCLPVSSANQCFRLVRRAGGLLGNSDEAARPPKTGCHRKSLRPPQAIPVGRPWGLGTTIDLGEYRFEGHRDDRRHWQLDLRRPGDGHGAPSGRACRPCAHRRCLCQHSGAGPQGPRPLIRASAPALYPHDWDVRGKLRALDLPTMIMAGRYDFICPVRWTDEMNREMGTSRVVVFEHSGHFAHVEQPEEFARAVLDFFR
ncbi:alpha/beta hydrolase [Streptomyces sp. ME03-5709C]|nr:alpha/beta hydrolase [Streptomyces sp. ME03-5709C]